jgi:hypothetical protein
VLKGPDNAWGSGGHIWRIDVEEEDGLVLGVMYEMDQFICVDIRRYL